MLRSPDPLAAPTTPQRWLFVLLLLASIAVGKAQEPALAQPAVGRIERDFLIDQWSISEGLPNSSVSAIGESTDGFLWVGTGDGLVRFDGSTFRSHSSGRDTDSGLMSIARDMHDQLGSDLTRVQLLGEMTNRHLTNPSRARVHLDRLAHTTLDLVRGLDEIVWAVNPAKDRLDDFLSYLGAYASEFSDSTGIACRTDFPAEIQSQTLPASVRHNLFLMVKESLNNAAKHAGVHEVHVRVQVLDHHVQVEVSDAGTGFDPASIRSGRHGLASLRQRMVEIGGQIRWDTAPGKGTRVFARVPLPH